MVFLLRFLLYLVSSEAQFAQTIIYEFSVVEHYIFWAWLMEPFRDSTSKQEVFAFSRFRPEIREIKMPWKMLSQLSREIKMSRNIVFEPNKKIFQFCSSLYAIFSSRLVVNKSTPCRFIFKTYFFIETSKLLDSFTLSKIKTSRNIVFKMPGKFLALKYFKTKKSENRKVFSQAIL